MKSTLSLAVLLLATVGCTTAKPSSASIAPTEQLAKDLEAAGKTGLASCLRNTICAEILRKKVFESSSESTARQLTPGEAKELKELYKSRDMSKSSKY